MSREVLEHKRDEEVAVQVWNLRRLPEGFAGNAGGSRLFVAVDGHWRGFFRLASKIIRNEFDPAYPYTLPFAPGSWTAVPPRRAPPRNRQAGYTLTVPPVDLLTPPAHSKPTTPQNETKQNETNELIALLEREEERE